MIIDNCRKCLLYENECNLLMCITEHTSDAYFHFYINYYYESNLMYVCNRKCEVIILTMILISGILAAIPENHLQVNKLRMNHPLFV